jgi:hypothetical protein
MFNRPGGWWLDSKIDPRWNCNGSTKSCGGFVMPTECELKIEQLKEQLGEPPDDLEYGYMKD